MARTPLLRHLLRALDGARGAAKSGVPLAEYHESRAAASRLALSRRRFLAGAASLPLVAACSSASERDPLPVPILPPSIAIVGAGIAGLHCAHRLKRLGLYSTIYEAGTRSGGRVLTDRTTFPGGQHCELGAEIIDAAHATMLDLATELDVELLDYHDDDPALLQLIANFGGKNLTQTDLLIGFQPIAAQMDAALATLSDPSDRRVTYDHPNGAEALDALSISAWLDQAGASGPIRSLIEAAFTAEYGLEPDVSSALNMLLLISTDPVHFDVFGDTDARFHAKDGSDTFATKLEEQLDEGQIELGTALEAVRKADDGRYVLSLVRDATHFEVGVDHVVLALPFSILRDLSIDLELPEPKRTAIDELGYGTNAKLMAGFGSRPWRTESMSNGGVLTDRPFQQVWETSRLQPGDAGILTSDAGGARGVAVGDGTPEEQLAAFLDDLEAVFPGSLAASNGIAARMHWPTSPLVKGSFSACLVGQYTTLAGAEIERFENVHFCGEHTSVEARGRMEGAAATGAAAALEIAADLGVSTTAAQNVRGRTAAGRAEQRILERAAALAAYR